MPGHDVVHEPSRLVRASRHQAHRLLKLSMECRDCVRLGGVGNGKRDSGGFAQILQRLLKSLRSSECPGQRGEIHPLNMFIVTVAPSLTQAMAASAARSM